MPVSGHALKSNYSSVSHQIIPKMQTSGLCRLPEHTLHKIFSYLSTNEIEVVVLVNKHFCKNAIDAARFNEPELVKVFIKASADKLRGVEVFHVQASDLNKIMPAMTFRDFPNLKEIKRFIFSVKCDLISVLKIIPKESFDALLEGNKPSDLIGDIALLTDFERRIDETSSISDDLQRSVGLAEISNELAKIGEIDRAINLAGQIDGLYIKEVALADIPMALAKAGKFERAIEIAFQSISWPQLRACAIDSIREALIEQRGSATFEDLDSVIDLERRIDETKSISDHWQRSVSLAEISKESAKIGKIDRAINLAGQIDNLYIKEVALADIPMAVAKTGKFERAIKLASQLIPSPHLRACAIANICEDRMPSLPIKFVRKRIASDVSDAAGTCKKIKNIEASS